MTSITAAKDYLDESSPEDFELGRRIYPYIRWSLIIVNVLRILSLIVARKYWGVVKYYFYLEVLAIIIESNLPVQRTWVDQAFFIVIRGSLNFVTDYFHFWPALACTQL